MYSCQFKFLFDFLVLENLDSTLLDVQMNSPKCSFFRVAQWFDFTNFIIEKKNFSAICRAVHRNELYTGLLYSGYLLSGTCCQKLTVGWHCLKFF